jgi:hypothetical protein
MHAEIMSSRPGTYRCHVVVYGGGKTGKLLGACHTAITLATQSACGYLVSNYGAGSIAPLAQLVRAPV